MQYFNSEFKQNKLYIIKTTLLQLQLIIFRGYILNIIRFLFIGFLVSWMYSLIAKNSLLRN